MTEQAQPLSAEEIARIRERLAEYERFVIDVPGATAWRLIHHAPGDMYRLLATIDAQATEIARLRGDVEHFRAEVVEGTRIVTERLWEKTFAAKVPAVTGQNKKE